MNKLKNYKLILLSLTLITVLVQGTCAYAASSSSSGYNKEDLDNLVPGWEKDDINKSNYKVNSYKNSFSSSQTQTDDTKDDTSSTKTSETTISIDSTIVNTIVSTSPSTGNREDFWGRTADGKWILIEQGVPASGWKLVRGKWYYMDSDGVMQTGWINYGENWYYLNSDGAMIYNTYVNGYYLDWNGAMQ